MGDLLIILFLMSTAFCYEVLYALNCGAEVEVTTHLVKYTNDQMFEGLNSKSIKKASLPLKFIDPAEVSLLTYERTTDGSQFSYFLKLTGQAHYALLLKFIEVDNYKQGQRLFEVKLGDESLFQVDIAGEVGTGEVLHKWVQFQLKEDVLYINGSMPLLNAYIYPKQKMKLTFARIRSQPKIQAIVLLKGDDSLKFVQQYLEYEERKNKQFDSCSSMKYQRQPIYKYKLMTGNQHLQYPQKTLTYYLDKIISLNTLYSLVAVALVILHQKIYEKLKIPQEKSRTQ